MRVLADVAQDGAYAARYVEHESRCRSVACLRDDKLHAALQRCARGSEEGERGGGESDSLFTNTVPV